MTKTITAKCRGCKKEYSFTNSLKSGDVIIIVLRDRDWLHQSSRRRESKIIQY